MYQEILKAGSRLRGIANRTPVMTSRRLNEMLRASIYIKCENFQRIGAFKFRGAFNAVSQLSDKAKSKGILTYSSGNHAQAIALVGKILNLTTTIVMPENAPKIKLEATRSYGAKIVLYDPEKTTREKVAGEIEAEHGYTLIPPYDHIDIVYGQGTAVLELMQEIEDIDSILVQCGGGGLLSGSAIAAKGFNPSSKVIGVEPELADDATKSFHTGVLHTVHNPPTIADGTRTPSLGKITFPLVREYVDDMVTVTEEAIIEAVRYFFYYLKLVVEPSGAIGLAALLSGVVQASGNTGIVISGGNIDGSTMANILK
ncbi:MAG: pyridoxal-phosphate dependent enzyme [Deltaproteobacteria bacterium]|mgnify:CR=1 FL=1|jgi:threo-3-hydroxy-L-aspartate ammonia-lyase|nr:pyridoxal-phosphate dependent enzyme [Deltaproteobacteria bacterium]MBT4525863.1 pyridoxal-phosphate dependent enzyme [Deltaproteobacteria bacterium]